MISRRDVLKLSGKLLLAASVSSLASVAALADGQLKIGDKAPDFKLEDQNGKKISLAEFSGKKPVVLFFYPKDMTPVCTNEACGFRDQYADFTKEGAEVFGISSDSVSSHKDFADAEKLPFSLLSDKDGLTRKAYGVLPEGDHPGRVTFIIDKEGKIRLSFNSMKEADKHVSEALRVLKSLHSA